MRVQRDGVGRCPDPDAVSPLACVLGASSTGGASGMSVEWTVGRPLSNVWAGALDEDAGGRCFGLQTTQTWQGGCGDAGSS